MKDKGGLAVKCGIEVILFILILVIESSSYDLFSQNQQTKPTRQSALEAYSKSNFEKAYTEFSQLLTTYSKDPLYKYYSGVCLVNLNKNSVEAESLLKEALENSSSVRPLPSDALFYLGRAQQMSGRFTEAIEAYSTYIQQVGKKIAKEQNVQNFIEECQNKKGKTSDTFVKNTENVVPEKSEIKSTEKESQLVITVPAKQLQDVSEKIPAGYDKMLDEALEIQARADSISKIVAKQKIQLEKLPLNERNAMKIKISENETAAVSYQKIADQKFSEAQKAMAQNPAGMQGQNSGDTIVNHRQTNITVQNVKNDVQTDSGLSNNEQLKDRGDRAATSKIVAEPLPTPVEIFSVFEVLHDGGDTKEKIAIDPEVPKGLIYRIQIAVFRNPVLSTYFKGIAPVYGFKVAGTDKTNYYAGMFRLSSDASKALMVVKNKGFKDAFVIALFENKPVSADRSALLEKEWGKKPLSVQLNASPVISADTIPPALAFRVEVTRTAKPLKPDVIQEITRMAGARGFESLNVDDGKIAYLIGKFITFESAAEYADLLIRNGYKEARVVAWLGKKEITVDTARQLFDELR